MSTSIYENGAYIVTEPSRQYYKALWAWLREVHHLFTFVDDEQIVRDNFAVVHHGHILAEYRIVEGYGWIGEEA